MYMRQNDNSIRKNDYEDITKEIPDTESGDLLIMLFCMNRHFIRG